MIDHIWSNRICKHYTAGILIDSLSDHFPVFYIEDNKHNKTLLPDKITRKINQDTITAFYNILKSTKWTNVLNEENPKLAFNNFFDIFTSARDVAFPEVKVRQKAV